MVTSFRHRSDREFDISRTESPSASPRNASMIKIVQIDTFIAVAEPLAEVATQTGGYPPKSYEADTDVFSEIGADDAFAGRGR